jgi:cell division septation protein DedD
MRFEIKAGGWILILVGLAGLSLIVFALGLFAGYDMAHNTAPEPTQAASVYPLPNPPPVAEVAKPLAPSTNQAVATKADKTRPANAGASSLAMDKDAGPVGSSPSRNVSNAAKAATTVAPAKLASSDTEADEKPHLTKPVVTNPPPSYASAAAGDSTGGHHKPFNIQIDAAMDRSNAEQMTARLQKLGYRAFMVPTDIGGQTWWRVRVGPYQSQDEASAAEQELRAKYKDAYTP